MGAGDRPEDRDQHDEDRAGRQRVAEQGQRDVLGQRLGHDAGADHGGDQDRGPERFRRQAPREVERGHQLAFGCGWVAPSRRPISRSFVPSDSLSMLRSGRLVKTPMRFFR